jgi:hypothetical protein
MRVLTFLSLLLGISFCQPALCSSVLPVAYVQAFGNYGDGSVWITLDRAHDQPGCPGPYIELPPNGPANQSTELKPASLAGPLIFEAAVPTENAPDKLKRATSWKNCC